MNTYMNIDIKKAGVANSFQGVGCGHPELKAAAANRSISGTPAILLRTRPCCAPPRRPPSATLRAF